MQTAEMTQFNTRMPVELKREGDAALKSAGFTPSQAVRSLWEYAARNAGNPRAIAEALSPSERPPATAQSNEETAKRLQAAEAGPRILEETLKGLGIPQRSLDAMASSRFATQDYKSLMEELIMTEHEEGERA